MQRSHLVAAFCLLLTTPLVAIAAFSDVPPGSPDAAAISFVEQAGIMTGNPDGTFVPQRTLNRAELAKIITYSAPKADCPSAVFRDVPTSAWYAGHVCAAVQGGVIDGYPDGTFRPANTVIFSEAAKMIVSRFAGAKPPKAAPGAAWYRPYVDSLKAAGAIPANIRSYNQELRRAEVAEMIYHLLGGVTPPPLPGQGGASSSSAVGTANSSSTGVSDSTKDYTVADLRAMSYPGSQITVEQDLGVSGNAHVSIISYRSEGLKIYAEMAVPTSSKPADGYPVIIMNHGSAKDPKTYNGLNYLKDVVSSATAAGYMVLKPDYRGYGKSEGNAVPIEHVEDYGAVYAIDVMNLLSSVKNVPDADSRGVVLWGHSLGATVSAWVIEVSTDPILKGAVLVAGAPPTAEEYQTKFPDRAAYYPDKLKELATLRDPANIGFINVPVQLHHGTADEYIPSSFTDGYANALTAAGKTVEKYIYDGGDHNFTNQANRSLLEQRSLAFFKTYLAK